MYLKIAIICLSLIYSANGDSYLYRCPTFNPGSGCVCSQGWVNSEWRVVVTCSGAFNNNQNDLRKVLAALDGYYIDELMISGYTLTRLPDATFANIKTRIDKITLYNCPYLQFFGTVTTFFDNLGDSLETLRLEYTNIRADEWGRLVTSLGATPKLRNLFLFNNIGTLIQDLSLLKTLTKLEKVVLRRNGLNNIQADLSGFTNLIFIDLSENGLKNFEILGTANSLTTILLNTNSLQFISQSTINNLPEIGYINVRDNQMSCYCTDSEFIVNNQTLADAFEGICYTPASIYGNPFGAGCIKGGRIISRAQGKSKAISNK